MKEFFRKALYDVKITDKLINIFENILYMNFFLLIFKSLSFFFFKNLHTM